MNTKIPEYKPPQNETVPPDTIETAPQPELQEISPLEKSIDDKEFLGARTQRIQMLKIGLETSRTDYSGTQSALEAMSGLLGIDDQSFNSPAQIIAKEQISREEKHIVKAEANYPGDWTLLLKERLLHPSMQEKMNALVAKYRDSFPDTAPKMLDKPDGFRSFQDKQALNFQDRVRDRFEATGVEPSRIYGKEDGNLGTARYDITEKSDKENLVHSGVVFPDAAKNGESLTLRQKNIIEAHEKGHAVRTFPGALGTELRMAFDPESIRLTHTFKEGYLFKPDEIAERMSQLKNYFGFSGNEEFSAKHLAHAREHYVIDTGLDNDMSAFLTAITPETEAQFLKVINEYPL